MRKYIFSIPLLLFVLQGYSQLEKTIHQTFAVESSNEVSLHLFGEYDLIPWANDHIMSETNIQLYDATEGIFEHYLKDGRYEMTADSTSQPFLIRSKDLERRPIRTKKGECYETVTVRVFVPDAFEIVNRQSLVRKNPLADKKDSD